MAKIKELNEKEKKILNILGENPNVSIKEFMDITGYKWPSTVSQKINKFEKMGYLRKGPYYEINLSSVGKNQLYFVYTDIRFPSQYRDLVFNLIKQFECWRWIYPTIDTNRFFVLFQVNHYNQIGKLLNMLKENDIISYEMFTSQNRWILTNPNFFGKEIPKLTEPDLDNPVPDISYPDLNLSITWREVDLRLMQYLQILTDNLRKIQKMEYKRFGNFWQYHQLKHSFKKIIDSGIVYGKSHHLRPYPIDECSTLLLFLECKDQTFLLQLMDQFAEEGRIHKVYTLAGDTGLMFLWASPRVMLNLLHYFDEFSDLEVRVAPLRTHNSKYLAKQSFHAEHFDIESQRWIFPYSIYEKEVKNALKKARRL
jgi:DNA-binding Lrp family transcriptional regulator